MVSREGVEIHFGKGYDEPVPNTSRRAEGLDACIRVDEVDQLAEELSCRGASVIEGPVDRVCGMREFNTRDCFGLMLAFDAEITKEGRDL